MVNFRKFCPKISEVTLILKLSLFPENVVGNIHIFFIASSGYFFFYTQYVGVQVYLFCPDTLRVTGCKLTLHLVWLFS